MASFGIQLSLFLLLALILSPQIQAREGKPFSFFTHFRTVFTVKDPQEKAESPAPIIAPTQAPIAAPTQAPITAPTSSAPIIAPTPESGSTTIPSGPAPEPEFSDRGEGYGLYGSGYSQYSPTKETPTTTTFENELLNEDFKDESYKTNYNDESYKTNYNNEASYTYKNNYNNEEYKSNSNNGYTYNNNNNYNGKEYNYNNNNYNSNKREGMSDTRFLENGKYYYHVNSYNNQNYDLNGYESERGSTENGYYETNQYPNEFDTMEEYEKQQERQGYTP